VIAACDTRPERSASVSVLTRAARRLRFSILVNAPALAGGRARPEERRPGAAQVLASHSISGPVLCLQMVGFDACSIPGLGENEH
jgi:hypothetical protein